MGSGHDRAAGRMRQLSGRVIAGGALALAVASAGMLGAGMLGAGMLGAEAAGAAPGPAASGPQLTVTPSAALDFPPTPVGLVSTPVTVTLTNTGTSNVLITGFRLGGADTGDFLGNGTCYTTATATLTLNTPTASVVQAVLLPGQHCTVAMIFNPGVLGPRSATLTVVDNTAPTVLTLHGTGTEGYWLAASDGGVFSYGNGQFEGSLGNVSIRSPVSSIAATPFGSGYWLLSRQGGIYSYGTTAYYGAATGPLDAPVVNLAATATGVGYWEVASDGGVFTFGTAPFLGSMGGRHLNVPMVGMAATPTGHGYYEVAADGGIFAFGTAQFHGSMGGQHLDSPIVGMAVTPTGGGYYEVAADGGIFAFGSAPFYGSMGGKPLNDPVVDIASTTTASYQELNHHPAVRARIVERHLEHPGWRTIEAHR
jgi:hypothetical protein